MLDSGSGACCQQLVGFYSVILMVPALRGKVNNKGAISVISNLSGYLGNLLYYYRQRLTISDGNIFGGESV